MLSQSIRPEPFVAVPIVAQRSEFERAKTTRAHLRVAGVTRPRLYENAATTMHVGFRSWRDTGIPWLALAGVDVAKGQRRARHDEISTTIGYLKAAEDVTGSIGYVAAHAGESIPLLTLAVAQKMTPRELAAVIHCYPTQVEAIQRSAAQTAG
jgi:hypothetical protein